MRDGRIEQIGTYAQIRSRPVNAFVAGFLGLHPLNLLPAVITEEGKVAVGSLHLNAPHGLIARKRVGEQVLAGVEPEDLVIRRQAASLDEKNSILGEVEVIEPDYAHRLQYVRVHTAQGVIEAVDADMTPIARGQHVRITGQGKEVQLFNIDSGYNLLFAV